MKKLLLLAQRCYHCYLPVPARQCALDGRGEPEEKTKADKWLR